MTVSSLNRLKVSTFPQSDDKNDNEYLNPSSSTTSPSKLSEGKTKGSFWLQLKDRRLQWSFVATFVILVMIMLSKQESNSSIGASNYTRIAKVVESPRKVTSTNMDSTTNLDSVRVGDSVDEDSYLDTSRVNPSMDKVAEPNKKKSMKPIKQISILGERNSGTRWTSDHIEECFSHTLSVERYLTRYKHWFQYKNYSKYPHDTLVLAQFRNPYEWLKAMEHVPHHSPAHLRTKKVDDPEILKNRSSAENDWKIFLTKPWTTERVGLDLGMREDDICTEDFLYRDIVSCNLEPLPPSYYNWTIRYSEHQPFYEMRNDGSGEPYSNIMEMRTDKIRNFLDVRNYDGVADVWVLQYEYLVGEGTKNLLRRIEEWTGVKAKCDAKEPQLRKPKASRFIAPDFAKFIRENLNWTVEEMVGYAPELKREEPQKEW